MRNRSGEVQSNAPTDDNWKNVAPIIGVVVILIIVVNFVGYEIGQRVGATNVPIATFFVSALVLFAFAFPLLRTYLEKSALDKLTPEQFDRQVSTINLAEDSPLAARGTYRFTLAVVVALILATGMFILATTSDLNATVTNLIQTILTVLTGAFASIVAFYYGTKAAESGAEKAKPTQPGTAAETLLATLEKLCDLDPAEDHKSIIKDLATEYTKLAATDKVAVLYGLQESDKCKNKKAIKQFKEAASVATPSSTPPLTSNGEIPQNSGDRTCSKWHSNLVCLIKFCCKELKRFR